MANEIYEYDETNPLGQLPRDVLRYSVQPQDRTTYLVELPDARPPLVQPPHHQIPRSRYSTILNTDSLPQTTEDEQNPLDAYIKKNLVSFRKGLLPQVRVCTSRRMCSEKGDEGSLPAIQNSSDALDTGLNVRINYTNMIKNDKSKIEPVQNVTDHDKEVIQSDSSPGVMTQMDSGSHSIEDGNSYKFSAINTGGDDMEMEAFTYNGSLNRHDRNDLKNNCNSNIRNDKKTNGISIKCSMPELERRSPQVEFPQLKADTIVLHVSDHVTLNQHSPFADKRQHAKKHPKSPVTVWILADSSSDEDDILKVKARQPNDTKDIQEHRPDKADQHKDMQNVKKRTYDSGKLSTTVETNMARQDDGRTTERANEKLSTGTRRKERKKKEKGGLEFHCEDLNSDVAHSGSDEDDIVKVKARQPNDIKGIQEHRPDEMDQHKDMQIVKKRTYDSGKSSKTVKPKMHFEDLDSHVEDSIIKVYKDGERMRRTPGKSPAESKRTGTSKPTPAFPLKAPKSAKQTYSMKRYHIQIPEHGQPEAWFNVCFKLDTDNSVDMNYEGPVKITGYYSTNKYS